MKTAIEQEAEDREKENAEAKRLLSLMDKGTALLFCKELAKKLPNINDTPPIKRLPIENYMQFYMFGVSHAIRDFKINLDAKNTKNHFV